MISKISILFIALNTFFIQDSFAQAIPVSIGQKADGQWQLYRNGHPFYIKGAGGQENLDLFKEIGGNSIRTWSAENAGDILDKAHEKGLTVMLGLWVQHERHGFDYDDQVKVNEQLQKFEKVVLEYKDHPALLLWAIGNEVDFDYSNVKVWSAVNDIASMIHKLDPNHPTTTITAELDQKEVELIRSLAPEIDIYSVNTYGGITGIASDIIGFGWNGPIIITEWGPNGHWEVGKTSWKAPKEQSSSEKYDMYLDRYHKYIEAKINCIGSYVFFWGQKQETTPTWYGLFTENGQPTTVVDAMYVAYNGVEPEKKGPRFIDAIIDTQKKGNEYVLEPNQTYNASVNFDAFGAKTVSVRWEVLPESTDIKQGGDREKRPETIAMLEGSEITFDSPSQEGAYRLFVYIKGNDRIAFHNIPFFVSAEK